MTENVRTCIASRWFLLIALNLFFTAAYAQKPSPADTIGAAYAEALAKSYSLRNEAFLESLQNETDDKKLLKYYQANFKNIFKALHEEIKDRQMAHMPQASTILQRMVKEIQSGNPGVPKDISIILVRSNIPNAYTLGDNTIFVNIGLLYYLPTEDEVASVLSHEIAHLLCRHTIKALNYSYQEDKEMTLSAKSILENKHKKADKALDALKTIVYNNGKNRRRYELEADSVGYLLFKNTHYAPGAFVKALAITDRYDTIRSDGLRTEVYKRFFELPNQEFKETWMQVEDFTSYNYSGFTEKLDKDSMSSHPGGRERIENLARIFPELNSSGTGGVPVEAFNGIKHMAEKERVPNLYIQEKYGEAVYWSLFYLQEKPNDDFYRSWLGNSFQKIYEARKDYKLNKYLDQVSPKDQSQSYIQFLSFMWNLKLEEIKNIAGFYN